MFWKKKTPGQPLPLFRPAPRMPSPAAGAAEKQEPLPLVLPPSPPAAHPPKPDSPPAPKGGKPSGPLPLVGPAPEIARPASQPAPGRKVNGRLLLALLLAVVVFGTGIHFLHAYQVKRNAGALLQRANLAERESDPPNLIRYLDQYLRLVPEDTEALVRFGLALDEHGRGQRQRLRAFHVLEQVVRRAPERNDLRRRLVTRALEMGQFADALHHVQVLLEANPDDGELAYQAGLSELGRKKYDAAAGWFEKAIRHAPGKVESYVLRAELLRRHLDRGEEADEVMNDLVEANRDSPQAYLARARYLQQLGQLEPAEKDLAAARKLAPDDADVLLASATLAQARGRLDEARTYLERGQERHPRNAEMYRLLAAVEVQARRPDQALDCLRRGLKAVPDAGPLRLLLAEVLLQEGKMDEAAEQIAQLKGVNRLPGLEQYFEARLLAGRDRWVEAARLLESVQPHLGQTPDLAGRVGLLLARCYEEMGETERRLAVYRKLKAADPSNAAIGAGLAAALLDMGRPEAALAEYWAVLPRAPEVRGPMARLMLLQTLALPPEQRRWTDVEQFVEESIRMLPGDVGLQVVRGEMLAAQGKAAEAQQVFEAARDRHPDRAEPWIALASLAYRDRELDKALSVLEQAEQRLGPRVELELARAQLALVRDKAARQQALDQIEKGLGRFSPADQVRLLRELANVWRRAGEPAQLGRLWGLLAQRRPDDLGCRVGLFELALQAGDDAAQRRLLDEIRRIEGEDGVVWRAGHVVRLIRKANTEPAALSEADKRLAELADRHPDWPRLPLLQAELCEAKKDFTQALEHYRHAIRAGESRPAVIRRAVQLLSAHGRFHEADELLRRLQEQAALPGDLVRWAAVLSLQSQDRQRSLELARQAVPADSTNYRDQLWRGQMLSALGQKEEAEPALRRAVALAEKEPETWMALVHFLAGNGQKEKAVAVMAEARQKLPPDRAPLTLAYCYEAIGEMQQADEHYQAALKARPDDPVVLRGVAFAYLRRGQPGRAVPHLRALVNLGAGASETEKAWARRQLALAYAAEGNFLQLQDALKLLDANARAGSLSPEDQRARALVLARMPGRRRQAIDLLEQLLRQQVLTPDDQFLLVQLWEAHRDWPRARERLLSLLAAHRANPRYLAYAVGRFLAHGEPEQAESWLARLEGVEPDSFRTLDVKARLLQAQGRPKEAVELIRSYATGKEADLGAAAALLDALDQPVEAEELYRRWTAQSKPEALLVFARFLGRRGRVAEALDLCEQARPAVPEPAIAATGLAVLYAAKGGGDQAERVERWLQAAAAKEPPAAWPLLLLAELRRLQRRYTDEQALCYKVLERDPNNVAALNNLAWLLVTKDGRADEALRLIEQAIQLGGPVSNLLDTRGLIRLTLGQNEAALKDLEEAAAQSGSANHLFHLAKAQLRAGNLQAAADAWRKAQAAGLTAATIHPFEKEAYARLAEELGPR